VAVTIRSCILTDAYGSDRLRMLNYIELLVTEVEQHTGVIILT